MRKCRKLCVMSVMSCSTFLYLHTSSQSSKPILSMKTRSTLFAFQTQEDSSDDDELLLTEDLKSEDTIILQTASGQIKSQLCEVNRLKLSKHQNLTAIGQQQTGRIRCRCQICRYRLSFDLPQICFNSILQLMYRSMQLVLECEDVQIWIIISICIDNCLY